MQIPSETNGKGLQHKNFYHLLLLSLPKISKGTVLEGQGQIAQPNKFQFSKEKNSDLVVTPAIQKVICIHVVNGSDKITRKTAPDKFW